MHPPPLNERRVVTVMSVDIVGSTRLIAGADPDDAQLLLDSVFACIQSAVESRGGSIVAFTGDGALVVFGWPDPSEHHADNACHAAARIHDAVAQELHVKQRVQVRIGVSSGLVLVRKINVGLVSRYDVIGDAAHRAAALQKFAAPGGTLACESTRNLSRLPDPAALTELDLGLRTGPIRAFALRQHSEESASATLGQRHHLPLVGRGREVALLRELVTADDQVVASLALIGEPGMGKSRLVAAGAALGVENGRMIILHECRDLDSASPFAAIRALVLASLAHRELPYAEALAEALSRASVPAEDYPGIQAIFGTAAAPQQKAVEPISQTRIARALAIMLATGIFDGAALLIVDDIHNIDPESLRALSMLRAAPCSRPLGLLVTGRPEAFSPAATLVVEPVILAPLDDASVAALLAQIAGTENLSPAVTGEIVSRAKGNPFVMTQLLHQPDLMGQGQDEVVLPRSIESLIHARLDRLEPETRQLAQSLGLMGETIELDLVYAVGGRHATPASLAELERMAFIHPIGSGAVRFRHALIAAACASSVVRRRRYDVHAAALGALSARTGDRAHLFPRLAHHAEEAGRDSEAIEYHWESARRARSLGASQSLMSTFERALRCCERLGPAGEARFVDLVLLVFETFHLQGEIDRIEPHLHRAAEFALRQGRTDKFCIAQCHLGVAAWYRGRFVDGERIMRPAFAQAKELGHLPLRFAAQFMLAQHLHNQGRIDEAVALVDELCGLLSGELAFVRLGAMGLPSAMANCHAGYYSLEAGRYEIAERYLRKGIAIAEQGADTYSESLACIALGRCFLLMGRNIEAVEVLERGVAVIERQGYDPALLNIAGLLAAALSRTQRPQAAIALAETRLKQGLLSRTGTYERHYFWCGYGEALLCVSRIAEGIEAIDKAIAIGRDTLNPCILVQSLALKSAALRATKAGNPEAELLEAEVRHLEQIHGLVAPRGGLVSLA